jgi:hypothetical protein
MRRGCLAGLLITLSVAGCETYRDALLRGQRALQDGDHDRALAIFRTLEQDAQRMPVAARAQYAYLRGMTDYRIGYQAEARHWLALGAAIENQNPGCLPTDWTRRLAESMSELNDRVYNGGIASLSNTPVTSRPGTPSPEDEVAADVDSGTR